MRTTYKPLQPAAVAASVTQLSVHASREGVAGGSDTLLWAFTATAARSAIDASLNMTIILIAVAVVGGGAEQRTGALVRMKTCWMLLYNLLARSVSQVRRGRSNWKGKSVELPHTVID